MPIPVALELVSKRSARRKILKADEAELDRGNCKTANDKDYSDCEICLLSSDQSSAAWTQATGASVTTYTTDEQITKGDHDVGFHASYPHQNAGHAANAIRDIFAGKQEPAKTI